MQAAFEKEKKGKIKQKAVPRTAGGEKWWDSSLLEWPENDFRIFVGDLGNETNDDVLAKAFHKYPACQKAKVVRDKRTNKTKGAHCIHAVNKLLPIQEHVSPDAPEACSGLISFAESTLASPGLICLLLMSAAGRQRTTELLLPP